MQTSRITSENRNHLAFLWYRLRIFQSKRAEIRRLILVGEPVNIKLETNCSLQVAQEPIYQFGAGSARVGSMVLRRRSRLVLGDAFETFSLIS